MCIYIYIYKPPFKRWAYVWFSPRISDVLPFGSTSCPKWRAFWPLAFTFPLQNAQLDRRGLTSCDHLEVGVGSCIAFCNRSKTVCFQWWHFGVFCVKLVGKLTFKCDKRCHFGTTRVTPCCNMLSFSQTLFLNDPTAFWLYFPTLAEPGLWKNVPRKHLKPIWRHVARKKHT